MREMAEFNGDAHMSISLSGTIEPRGQTTASAILGSVDGANTAIAVVLGSIGVPRTTEVMRFSVAHAATGRVRAS